MTRQTDTFQTRKSKKSHALLLLLMMMLVRIIDCSFLLNTGGSVQTVFFVFDDGVLGGEIVKLKMISDQNGRERKRERESEAMDFFHVNKSLESF